MLQQLRHESGDRDPWKSLAFWLHSRGEELMRASRGLSRGCYLFSVDA
jgi:hypothetical protein